MRQLLDCYKQVTGTAGDYQVEGAKTFQTLNVGGSGTTSVSFVVGWRRRSRRAQRANRACRLAGDPLF